MIRGPFILLRGTPADHSAQELFVCEKQSSGNGKSGSDDVRHLSFSFSEFVRHFCDEVPLFLFTTVKKNEPIYIRAQE